MLKSLNMCKFGRCVKVINPTVKISKIEFAFYWLIFGPVIPITLFLAGWWISLPFVRDNSVFVFALAGFVAGLIIDVAFVRQRIKTIHTWSPVILAAIYLFYAVCVFGFFREYLSLM